MPTLPDDEMASLARRVALCACIAAAWDFFAPPPPKHAPLLEKAAPFRLVGVFHKTGTDFTIKLQTELERVAGVASGVLNDVDGRLDRALARLDRDPRRAKLWRAKHPDTPLATLRAAFPTVRVVVLVRDPVALVVSGYNYHAQPRAPEGWIDRVRTAHPCNAYQFRFATVQTDATLIAACDALQAKYAVVDRSNASNLTYGELLKTATEFDGLRLEFFSTMIRSPENVRIGMWAAWAGGAGTGFALASMAAFYAEPRPTLACIFGALGLPVDAAQTEEIADAIVDSYAGKRNRSQHVTSSRHDTARQEALLLSDATARLHLLPLRAALRQGARRVRVHGHWLRGDDLRVEELEALLFQ